MFEKISHCILYWLGLMILSFVVVLTVFKLSYIGPPSEFWNHFGEVPQIIFAAGTVLAVAVEVVVRLERRKRNKKRGEGMTLKILSTIKFWLSGRYMTWKQSWEKASTLDKKCAKCPKCAELIEVEALTCRFCGSGIPSK